MKNQLILMYVKDNILYPITLNKDQKQVFDIIMHVMPGQMHYIGDKPIGQVIEKPKAGD